MNILTYLRLDLWRNLRNFTNTFFIAVLPLFIFLAVEVPSDFSTLPLPSGHGNTSAYVLLGISVYGAATAMTSLAGAAAVEIESGWGRQLALTRLPDGGFVLVKTLVAAAAAILPIVVLNIAGIASATEMTPGRWVLTAMLSLVGALPFALFGLAAGLAFRSDAAVGAASGILVILGFAGNAFIPLGGALLEVGRYTPMYGATALARYPVTDGDVFDPGAVSYARHEDLWFVLANLVAWTIVFAAACVVLRRRRATRR